MALITVGKNLRMQRQEVRGVFTTDLSPLLKIALATMPSQPPHKTQTQELGADDAQSAQQVEKVDQEPFPRGGMRGQQQGQQTPQQNPQQQPQNQQQGVGGSFQRPGAMPNANQQQDPEQQQQDEIAQRKVEYRKVLKLERALVKKLKEKSIKTKIKVKTSPKGLTVMFDTSHKIIDQADGQAKSAEEALADIIDWWKVDVGGDATYDLSSGGGTGRDIDKVDPSDRVQFIFAYAPQAQKQEQQDEVTTMNSHGMGGDRRQQMGLDDSEDDQELVGAGVGDGGEEREYGIGGAGKTNRSDSRMGNPAPPKATNTAKTLPEILALRKEALVNNLSKILAGSGVQQ